LGQAQGKGIVKAPPGAPTLAPDANPQVAGQPPPPASKPRGKQAGMPKGARPPASEPASPLPSYLDGDPYVGQVFGGRFEVVEKLGEGGFGAVYRGIQTATGREVALKVLHPEMTRDDNVVARFRREGEVLCNLRDAHTITTYDFDRAEDGTLFLAMELLSGRSLHDVFTDEAPIAWDRMLRLVVQMCSSLHEAHLLGIVHRDLKPENIYLEQRPGHDEYVKILDFGIAKVVRGDGIAGSGKQVAQLTATGQTLGTLEYMSPEQLMGRQLDGRSDVYAVGVLCYEMMTGQLPFPDAIGPAAQIAAQLKKTPKRPSEIRPQMSIPAAVDDIVLKCLGKRPGDRYEDINGLRTVCEELLDRHERGNIVEPGKVTAPPEHAAPEPVAPEPSPPVYTRGVPPIGPAPTAMSNRVISRVWWVLLGLVVLGGAAVGTYMALR
jgi:serine/threonine-protein kinase